MKQYSKRSSITDRERVIRDMISTTRKNIILTELELEFLQQAIEKTQEPQTEEELQGYNMMINQADLMQKTIQVSIEKLNFLKQKRTDFHAKNAMKDYYKFPETISENELVECSENIGDINQ